MFKDPLLQCIDAISNHRREALNYPLVNSLMQASGFTPSNGFLATNKDDPINKLTLEFGNRPLTAILDWALWLSEIYYLDSPKLFQIAQKKSLICHATGRT